MSLQSLVDLRFVQNNIFHNTASCSSTVMALLDVENKLLTNSRQENQDRDHLRAKKNRKEKLDLDLVMLV